MEEVEIKGTICAGKKFRGEIFPGNEVRFCKKFTREYACVSKLRHKHIVQYHGICFLPDSKLPVLVMERLVTSLYEYLLNSDNTNLDLTAKVSILRGIAKGLVYLHNQTPAIIHRDLTAKNVLLDSKSVPKIGDFGNSQIFDIDPSSAQGTMTNVPGTLLYMPPEACDEDARYNTKLDIFSYGHLALFTATQVFPCSLLPTTYYSKDLLSKDGGKRQLLARTEVERRKKYFDMLGDRHPLTNLIKKCLDNDPEERPEAAAIKIQLKKLRQTLRSNPASKFLSTEKQIVRKRKEDIPEQNGMISY